ncbi:MAG: isoaspartyl peptidase/L-asparaginase [Methanomassiliicoccales archaeon]
MIRGIVAHGGAGAPASMSDGPAAAAGAGMTILSQKGSVLDAVVEAVRLLEDDERFNAGTGSVLRFDGIAYMDASVMSSDGVCGAVAGLTRTKNPVLVARRVSESPHVLLIADGAVEFARRHGFPDYDPTTQRTLERLEKGKAEFDKGKRPAWPRNWSSYTDTVGAVAADGNGNFAAAASTGGVFPALKGRVGDVPLFGCGVFAGPEGAVAATGIGEEIIRKVLCRTVYCYMEEGEGAQQAVERGISLYDKEVNVGLIAIDKKGFGIAATGEMASGFSLG